MREPTASVVGPLRAPLPLPSRRRRQMASEDFFIRRYVRERDRGDMTRGLEIWEELVVRSFDRIRAQVRTFRFPGGQRLDTRHHDDATAAAFTRVYQLGTNFRGHTAAEFRAAAAK